ncbi:Virginiamycin B lyase [Pseudidiomarina piscicola]|uniref:Virginiamycin B lyase n=1 Tax=Pseudidiomarina piscicola TaxID=2614830 RepID=A0A6S6WS93_9GAMM|nr:lyase [Pseudidiomarina piscicola]CAB0151514.1 Virginiamycin B lyase [Pseudidiomarina piscicola]VZT40993.1 Virginiamycin B lyase [Pseudomonas aeruginosa]
MLGLTLSVLLSSSGATVTINEWQVPWPDSRPRDPYVQTDNRVWFVGQRADYAAVLNPKDGSFERIDLPDGAGPHNIIVDQRGAWYAGNKAAHIGKIAHDDNSITQYPLPGDGRRDVHTMQFTSSGDIWFTAQGANKFGFFDADKESIELYDIATPRARPYGLILIDDQPWLTLFGSNKLVTYEDAEVVEIELPRASANRPRRLAEGTDGGVWYVDYAGGYLGRYDRQTETVSEWQMPASGGSLPYAMAADNQGYIWFAETGPQPNRIVGFHIESETFTDPVAVPSGGGTVRHMVFDDASQSLWFGTDANTIGQAKITYSD